MTDAPTFADPISDLMESAGLTFPEAVERLARELGYVEADTMRPLGEAAAKVLAMLEMDAFAREVLK